jgi:hypothetical protein
MERLMVRTDKDSETGSVNAWKNKSPSESQTKERDDLSGGRAGQSGVRGNSEY